MSKKTEPAHKVTTRQETRPLVRRVYRDLLKHTVCMTLKTENVDLPCVVNILMTDDEGIRKLNKEHRGIDKATDVLSFPMQDFITDGWRGIAEPDLDLDEQTVPLGDIVMSLTTIKRNARKYKHTFEQETVRMIIHSTLHLMGYDHCKEMQHRETRMMRDMGYVD